MTPLQTGTYEAPGLTPLQRALGLVVVLGLLVLFFVVVWRSNYFGLPSKAASLKGDYGAARADATLHRTRITSNEALQAATADLHALIEGDLETPPGTRSAARAVGNEILAAAVPYWKRLPPMGRRLAALALGAVVFGAVAVSTEAVLDLLRSTGGGPGPIDVVAIATAETTAFVAAVGTALASQPGVATAWNVAIQVTLLTTQLLYRQWWLLAGGLALGAVVMGALARRAPTTEPGVVRSRLGAALRASGYVVAAWILGIWLYRTGVRLGTGVVAAGPVTIPYDGPTWGALAGLTATAALLVVGAVHGAARLRDGMRERAPADDPNPVAYLVAHAIWSIFGTVAVPFVIVYAVAAIPKLPTIAGAVLAAAWYIQAALAIIGGLVLAVLVLAARDAWPTVRQAIGDAVSRSALRAKLVLVGVPVLGAVTAALLVLAIIDSIPIAVATAVLAGALAAKLRQLLARLRYRANLSTPERTKAAITVEAAPLHLAGETHYYARLIGTHELLAPTPEMLVDAIQTAGAGLFTDGRATRTLAHDYHQHAADAGILDYEESTTKAVEKARKPIFHELRKEDARLEKSEFERRLNRKYPEPVWRRRLDLAKERGNILEIRADGESHLLLRNDPFARTGGSA